MLRAGHARSWRGWPARCTVVDEVHGFNYFDERDLLGFVDGTENPTGAARVAAAIIGAEDPDFAGGSYVIVQKYLHDLAAWNALPVEEQERVIGRTKLDDIELDDEVKPTYSHNALNTIVGRTARKSTDPARQHAVRPRRRRASSAPTSSATRARPRTTEQMLTNMFVGSPPGNYDRMLDFSTRRHRQPVLRAVGDTASTTWRADDAAPRTTTPAADSQPAAHRPADARRLARHRQPEEESPSMNNLHRELAPISDAAWAQIEEEAARTFKRHVAGRRVVDVLGPPASRAVRRRHRPPADIDAPGDGVRGPAARACSRWSSCGCRSTLDRAGRSTTSSAAPRTPTGSRSRTPPGRSPSPRTAPSSTATRPAGIERHRARARATRRSRCPPTSRDYPDASRRR